MADALPPAPGAAHGRIASVRPATATGTRRELDGTGKDQASLTVLYDGACPLCRREISVYRGLRLNTPVRFADVSDPAVALPPGSTREQLLARFHVRGHDGELHSGAQAFLTLWAALPGWRWLARAGRLPGVAPAIEQLYRLFLRARPALQRLASRLERTASPP